MGNAMAIFNAHDADADWKSRSGQLVDVLRQLDVTEMDIFDAGPSFRIRFADGLETNAFEDELTFIYGR